MVKTSIPFFFLNNLAIVVEIHKEIILVRNNSVVLEVVVNNR
jgi:hypothetical protein